MSYIIECNHVNTGRVTTYSETWINSNNYEVRYAYERCAWCRRTVGVKPETIRYVAPTAETPNYSQWGNVVP